MEWWQDPSGAQMQFWNPASIQTSPEMEMFRALQQNPQAMMPRNNSLASRIRGFERDPSLSLAALAMGSRLLQGRRPGQNIGGAIGESVMGGANTYLSDVDRRQKKSFLDTQQTLLKNQDVRAGKQDVRAEAQEGREKAAEGRRDVLFPLEARAAAAKMTAEELGLEITKTYGLDKVKKELDLLTAQTEEVRARAQALGQSGGGSVSANMQTINAISGALKAKNLAEGREAPDHDYVLAAFEYVRQTQSAGKDPIQIEQDWYELLKPDPLFDEDGSKDRKARQEAKAIANSYSVTSPSLSDIAKNLGAPVTGPAATGGMDQGQTGAPGSNGYGNRQWPLLIAAAPNMPDEAFVAAIDKIKMKDPGWHPPVEHAQRYNMLKEKSQLQAPMSF